MHRIVQITTGIILLSVVTAIWVAGLSPWWILVVMGIYFFILFLGTVRIGMRYFLNSRIHGPRTNKQVALTFDDGPDHFTLDVARCLEKHGVRGAFFLIGKKVEQNPETVRELVETGHVVGNHGYYHQWYYPLKFTASIRKEMQMTSSEIYKASGKKTRFFRPPFGITNPRIARAVKAEEFISFGWDVRSFDTVLGTSSQLASRLKRKVKNGSIILLHDTGEGMVGFLDTFIPWLKKKGYEIVSLEKLIHEKAYH